MQERLSLHQTRWLFLTYSRDNIDAIENNLGHADGIAVLVVDQTMQKSMDEQFKVMLLLTMLKSHKPVTAYLKSELLPPFGFAQRAGALG